MKLQEELNKASGIGNLELLAHQVVEGFISGIHKSPFHGFSAEFAEHKIYNSGESSKHIDWKLYAKTDKLYTKRYEEETNLRCHLIIDSSASMYYPLLKSQSLENYNKIGFSVLAAAAIMHLLKKQRDAVGLSIYNENYDFFAPEKGGERHRSNLLVQLEKLLLKDPKDKKTNTYAFLHQIAEKLKRRSLLFLFTDMLQPSSSEEALFEALRHLKFNKHEVILFHTFDADKELHFNFDNTPKRFTDLENGEQIDLFPDTVKNAYQKEIKAYFKEIKFRCLRYQINYIPVDIHQGFDKIISTFLIERKKFK